MDACHKCGDPFASRHATSLTMSNFIAYKNSLKTFQRWPHSQVIMGGVDISRTYYILVDETRFVGKLVGTPNSIFIELIPNE